VLRRASEATREIVIWDNGSTDGTAEYLASVDDPRIRVVRSPSNVGFNAYAEACEMTSAPFFVELDDDVVDAPAHWDLLLRDSFVRLPHVGYLAADLEGFVRGHLEPKSERDVGRLVAEAFCEERARMRDILDHQLSWRSRGLATLPHLAAVRGARVAARAPSNERPAQASAQYAGALRFRCIIQRRSTASIRISQIVPRAGRGEESD